MLMSVALIVALAPTQMIVLFVCLFVCLCVCVSANINDMEVE